MQALAKPLCKLVFLKVAGGEGFFTLQTLFFPGPAARAFFGNVFLRPPGVALSGPAARAFLGNVSLHPSGVVLFGPAARAFSPSGHSASGGELFARPKSSSKTAPSGGPAGPFASLPTPSGASLNLFASGGAGGVKC